MKTDWINWPDSAAKQPSGRVDYKTRDGRTGYNMPVGELRWFTKNEGQDIVQWRPAIETPNEVELLHRRVNKLEEIVTLFTGVAL